MNATEALLELGKVIDNLTSDLKKYAIRAEAQPACIDKQSDLIVKLVSIYDNLDVRNAEIWGLLCKKMEEMKLIDPYLAGFEIRLREKPLGCLAQIDFNLF